MRMHKMGSLKEAFDRGRLAAVHVDLQNCYFRAETMAAYPVANDLASSLRDHGVANHWVAYTRDWAKRTPVEYQRKYANTMLEFHRTIDIAAGEMIFEKAAQGAFDHLEAPLYQTLADDGVDAIVVTGVIHSACVAETVAGAMAKNLQVFAAIDATDCHVGDHLTWQQSVLHALNDPACNHLLTVTTTHDIKRALSPGL